MKKNMKKIMIMLAIILMASLASPLFATNTSPPSFEYSKKINGSKEDVTGVSGCSVAGEKVYVLHRDNLMCSLESTSMKGNSIVLSFHQANANKETFAVRVKEHFKK